MDYYREYLETIDSILSEFIEQREQFMTVGDTVLSKAVKNQLWSVLILNGTREYYNDQRKLGTSVSELRNNVLANLLQRYSVTEDDHNVEQIRNQDFSDYDFLKQDSVVTTVFCMNERQINLWMPILSQISTPILMLCNFNTDQTIFPDGDFTVLDLNFITDRYVYNKYLKRHFTQIFEYANLFTMLVNVFKPNQIMVMEGCHSETEILAAIGRSQSVETICYQQGWPSVIHTRFRDMGYDRFITWGRGFNELWQKYNPYVKFETGHYPYPIGNHKATNTITFFLQAPIIISDYDYFNQLFELAVHAAINCPESFFMIKEHPEFRLTNKQKEIFRPLNNVEFVSDTPLVDIFERTLISVSIFSSTIIESLAHGSIPFIFDPSTDGGYYPSASDWGVEAYSLETAKQKLVELILNKDIQNFTLKKISKILH